MTRPRKQFLGTLKHFAVIPVESFEVEVELTEVFRSECADFEFDGDETNQAAMKKEQIEGKILSADLEGMLGTDEAEIAAQLVEA